MKNFFKRLFGGSSTGGFVFTTRSMAQNTANGERVRRVGTDLSGGTFITIDSYTDSITSTSSDGRISANKQDDARKAVEPIAVFGELKNKTPEISFEQLDEKIAVVKERIAILREHLKDEHLGDENRTLFYLENRKKYLKTMKKKPLDWAMTTYEAVDDLCKRYKLKVVPLKQYYTLVPQEGLKELERYTIAYEAVTGDKPIFELVIKDVPTETKKKDRDPILLANSPLGNFLFVLGAWDDEVEIVDEIIYQGK